MVLETTFRLTTPWWMKSPWWFTEFRQRENQSGSRTIAENMQILHKLKKYSMVVSRTFAKHREKRNFANRFIHSAERDSWRNRIKAIPKTPFDHLLLVQRKGSAMASGVPVAPLISMFTSLKWMRFERDFWELCPKAIVQNFSVWPDG
jgi:hypothetical protein